MDRPPLWTRLKEAKAVQIVLVYLGVCWFVVQLVSSLQEMLELPAWIGPVTLVLLGIGLVVVLATAWVQSLPRTTAAEEAGEIPTDWQIAPSDALESLREGRLPHLTWGRAILGGVVALSLAIGAAGGYVLIRGGGGGLAPSPVGASAAQEGVAVLPFTVSGPGLDEFEQGMVSLLSMNIDGIDGIRSVNPRTVMAEWEREGGENRGASLADALRVAESTGARYAVVGDAVSAGESVRFTAELYDLADGSSVGRGGAEGFREAILGVIDEMSVELLRTLVAESGSQTSTGIQRLEGLVTSSVEALNAYLQGEQHFREGRTTEALEAYERAVTTDSTFALAWTRIASVYGWIDPIAPELSEARQRAMALIDRLPPREATLIRGYSGLTFQGPRPEVLADLRRHVRRFPDDPEGWAVLGEYYLHVPGIQHTEEEVEEAVLRAVDLDPSFAPNYVHALRYLVGKGDWRFFEYMEMYRGIVTEERASRYQMQWDFYHGGDEARAAAEDFYQDNPLSAVNTIFEVYLDSDSIAQRSLDMIRLALEEYPYRPVYETHVLASLGRFEEMREEGSPFETFLTSVGVAVTSVVTDATVDGVTPPEAVERLSVAAEALVGPRGEVPNEDQRADVATLVQAARALEHGQPTEAREALLALPSRGAMVSVWGWWTVFYAESLARAGRPAEAIEWFESEIEPWRAIARLRLGELYEELEDQEAAAENYRGFLRLFREADAGVSGLVERGRDGLARVGG